MNGGCPSGEQPAHFTSGFAVLGQLRWSEFYATKRTCSASESMSAKCQKRTRQPSQGVLIDLAVMMTTKFLPGSSNSLMLAIGSPVNQQQVIASQAPLGTSR